MAQGLFIERFRFRITAPALEGRARFHQHDEVARIKLYGALEVGFRFREARSSPIYSPRQNVNPRLVRQQLLGRLSSASARS